MDELDKKLKVKFSEELETSEKYDTMLKDTIEKISSNKIPRNKFNIEKNKILRIVAIFIISILVIGSTGTFGLLAYSALGGTIYGKTIPEWMGIKFSDSYRDYEIKLTGKSVSYNETTVDLISSMCDDGFTVLEFDVKLSKEDKEYLKIGENVYSEEELDEERNKIESHLERLVGTSEEQYIEKYKKDYEEELQNYSSYINTVQLLFNTKFEESTEYYNYNNNTLILDNEELWARWSSYQITQKVSEYEYRIYQYYFLPDDKIKNKTEFNLKFENIILINGTDKNNISDNTEMFVVNTPNNEKMINLDGEINVNVSKEKALENTKYIDVGSQMISYNKMNKTIEKVLVTPMQTIIKVKTVFYDINSRNVDQTLCLGFNVYNQDEKIIKTFQTETKRIVKYSDGTLEEWEVGDIGTNNDFSEATIEITEYIVVGNDEEINKLRIVPTIKENIEIGSHFNIDIN